MKIGTDVVVGIDYVIRDARGREVDRAPPGRPFTYLQGARACPRGLERALEGRTVGDRVQVELPPSETYGERSEDGVFRIARAQLPAGSSPEAGMIVAVVDAHGETELRVVEVDDERVTVDANHPLAGQTLRFEVEVVAVRPATAHEILAGEPLTAPEREHRSDPGRLPI